MGETSILDELRTRLVELGHQRYQAKKRIDWIDAQMAELSKLLNIAA